MRELLTKMYSVNEISLKRDEVRRGLIAGKSNLSGESISKISTEDVKLLFDLYDKIFFDELFKRVFAGKMKFSLSPRLTRSAGKTLCPKNIGRIKPEAISIEIRMGIDFFFKYNEIQGEKKVCGIVSENAVDAFMLVFEHELGHVIEFLNFHSSKCSGKRFRTIVANIFGHSESSHQLPTGRKIADEKYGIKIGDNVSFLIEKVKKTGLVYNIQKRATVMVKDDKGAFVDTKGTRYTKFYVPIVKLEKHG